MTWAFNTNHIEIKGGKPRSCKKITMTRLGAILGINRWQSPFEAWCEITKIYKKPFEESKETRAGKIIEPIVRNYLKNEISSNVLSPEEYFGYAWHDVSSHFDFYQDKKIFGGMWDTVLVKNNDASSIKEIFEQKTTKRVEDWVNETPPYYLIQGLGYCYMEHVDRLTMTCSFLQDKDYAHPENFEPSEDNTILRRYNVNEPLILLNDGVYYTIEECFQLAEEWWNKYVETGISPDFDEVRDKDILKELRTTKVVSINGIDNAVDTYLALTKEYEEQYEKSGLLAIHDKLESLKTDISEELKKQFKEEDSKLEYKGLEMSKSYRTSVDTQKLKDDGIYEQYSKKTTTYTLKIKKGE